LDTFKKLLLVRSFCPDRTLPMAKKYIAESLGQVYAEGIILNMESMWQESEKRVPLVCFLSMGSDPTDNIMNLAKKQGLACGAISMGQGQEVHARRLLQQRMNEGGWILLQNCHLGLNFLEELLETILTTEQIDDAFRCWVTTEPHPKFSINLLQSSIKFTNEPPQGIKAGLKRTYATLTQDTLDISNLPYWKPMLFCVAFLHTTVQERRKFGPLGWNIPYEFNQSDFSATVQFIQNHLDELDPKRGISWQTVRYMIGEIQYGGRVTDDYDKRLLNTYGKQWFSEIIFGDKFEFAKGYKIPKCRLLAEYRNAIDTLPLNDSPEAFGLHPNADITYQTNTAAEILSTIVSIQPKDSGGGGGETRESVVYKLCDDMLEKLPEDYVPHEVKAALQKADALQPLNIFLKQEVDRMQKVISTVRSTLKDLKLAIDGTIIMNENLRDALDNMFDARVPAFWRKYVSFKFNP
jgi:dynein heavy chain